MPTPRLSVFPPSQPIRGPYIPIRFVVGHDLSESVTVAIQRIDAAGTLHNVTPGPMSDRLDALPAPPAGVDYRFIWNAGADVAQDGTVTLEVVARAGAESSAPVRVNIAVSVQPPPAPAPVPAPEPRVEPELVFLDGDDQVTVPGCLFARPLRVRVRDKLTGRDLHGARVAFTADAPTLAAFEVGGVTSYVAGRHRDTAQDWAVVETRVRASGATGDVLIRARIAGTVDPPPPSTAFVEFRLRIRTPRLVASTSAIGVTIDGAGEPGFTGFGRDDAAPLLLDITPTNAFIDRREIRVPERFGAPIQIGASRIDPALPASVRIALRGHPGVAGHTFPVDPPAITTAWRTMSVSSTGASTGTPVDLYLDRKPGTATQLVSFPGRTVALPLLEIRDTVTPPNTYAHRADADTTNLLLPIPPLAPVRVRYRANNGEVSLDAGGANGVSEVEADIGTQVYFTPRTLGASQVMARVRGLIHDPHSPPVGWTPSGGTPVRYRTNLRVPAGARMTCAILIQGPGELAWIDDAGAPVSVVEPGVPIRLRAVNLSSASGGTPEQLTIESIAGYELSSSFAPSANIPWLAAPQRRLAVSSAGADAVESARFVATFDPATTGHLVVPGGELLAYHHPDLAMRRSVVSRLHDRVRAHDPCGIEEAPTDVSPSIGGVFVHSGEAHYRSADLDVRTRAGTFAIARVYRSQVECNGPLGPGWSFAHDHVLDLSRLWNLRWCTGSGCSYTFDPLMRAPRGLAARIDYHATAVMPAPTFTIRDPQRNTLGFSASGILVSIRDRAGNTYRFRHDERARLVEIKDPHQRVISFTYAASDPHRLASITADGDRVVDYAFHDGTAGPAGYLKSATFPPAPARVGTGDVDDHRRTENYEYEVDLSDPQRWRLARVITTSGIVLFENQYDQFGRVVLQKRGDGEISFVYRADANGSATDITRNGAKTTFTFPRSPFPDAAAPIRRDEIHDALVRPAGSDRACETRFDADARLVWSRHPSGEVNEWVYAAPVPPPVDPRDAALLRRNVVAHYARDAANLVRVSTFEYDADYNEITRAVDPEGNAILELADVFATKYTYRRRDAQERGGQVTSITGPEAMHFVVVPTAAGGDGRELRWVCGAPIRRFAYNDFGLVMRSSDPHGVVSEYAYYADDDPTGATHAPSPTGGGLLASVTADVPGTADAATAANAKRDQWYLPNTPLAPRTTSYRYDKYGSLVQLDDPGGVRVRVADGIAANKLREYTSVVLETTAGEDPLAGTSARDRDGSLVEHTFGDTVASLLRDARGRTTTMRSVTNGMTSELGLVYDRDDHLVKVRRGGFSGPQNAGIGLVLDERKLAARVQFDIEVQPDNPEPVDHPPRERAIDIFTNGVISGRQTDGAWETAQEDGFGEVVAVAGGNSEVLRLLRDPYGGGEREVRQWGDTVNTRGASIPTFDAAATIAFTETRRDELGRARRVHIGQFMPPSLPGAPVILTSPGGPIEPSPEHLVPIGGLGPAHTGVTWPPADRTRVVPGENGWGPPGRLSTDLTFDAEDQLVRAVDPFGSVQWVRRDPHGRPVEQAYRDAKVTYKEEYLRTVITRTVGTGATKRTSRFRIHYNVDGRPKQIVDNAGHAIYFEYARGGMLTRISDAIGPLSTNQEFPDGVAINEPGNRIEYIPDRYGGVAMHIRLTDNGAGGGTPDTSTLNANAEILVKYFASEFGRSVSDGDGNTIDWHTDPATGQWTTVRFTDGQGRCAASSASIAYGDDGRISSTTDANGTVLHFAYEGDRLKTILARDPTTGQSTLATGVSGPAGYAFRYTDAGVVAAELPGGRITSALQDSTRAVRFSVQGSRTVAYSSAFGDPAITYPCGDTPRWNSDPVSKRVTSIEDRGVRLVEWTYAPDAQFDTISCGGARVRITETFADGLSKHISVDVIGGAIEWELERDRMGRITKRTRRQGATTESRTWRYDSAGRPRQERILDGAGNMLAETTRQYDGVNVLRVENVMLRNGNVTVRAQTAQERGRIVTLQEGGATTGTTAFTYDGNGNLKSDGRHEYAYDAWNRLVTVRTPGTGALVAEYRYDAVHRLVQRSAQSGNEHYVYDGPNLIETWSDTQCLSRYVYDARGRLVVVRRDTRIYFVLRTPEGWIDALVESAEIRESYDYDLRGGVTTANLADAPGRTRFVWHGELHDPATGLHCAGGRWYHPRLGQFLTPDPEGWRGGPNHYALPNLDPINLCSTDQAEAREVVKALLALPPTKRNMEAPSIFSDGVGTTVGGTVTLVLGGLVLASNPVGWFIGLTGALMVASGIAATALGVAHMASSSRMSRRQNELADHTGGVVLALSSPTGWLGVGGAAIVTGGDVEAMETWGNYAGLAEGGVMLVGSARNFWRMEQEFDALVDIANNNTRRKRSIDIGEWDGRLKAIHRDLHGLPETGPQRRVPWFTRPETTDLSHMVPQRSKRVGIHRPWNISPLRSTEHALMDGFKYLSLKPEWRVRWLYRLRDVEGLVEATRRGPPRLRSIASELVELLEHRGVNLQRRVFWERFERYARLAPPGTRDLGYSAVLFPVRLGNVFDLHDEEEP